MKKVKIPVGRPKFEFTKSELIELMNRYGTTRNAAKAVGVSQSTISRKLSEENIILKWVDGYYSNSK